MCYMTWHIQDTRLQIFRSFTYYTAMPELLQYSEQHRQHNLSSLKNNGKIECRIRSIHPEHGRPNVQRTDSRVHSSQYVRGLSQNGFSFLTKNETLRELALNFYCNQLTAEGLGWISKVNYGFSPCSSNRQLQQQLELHKIVRLSTWNLRVESVTSSSNTHNYAGLLMHIQFIPTSVPKICLMILYSTLIVL